MAKKNKVLDTNKNFTEKIVDEDIYDLVLNSFVDYAMNIIVARAIPDVRDGLKPVHRRILYAMNDLGFTSDKEYRKSATTVGEVLGKYHPHGDVAVYDTMVRLAQDFSLRYPLIDGHGNFGSIDGDSAAAMRYTESRLTPLASEMLRDLSKDTVDFIPNYDEKDFEPSILPSKFPNLLVNGAYGIAVAMATNMPSHNINEVIDATRYVLNKPKCSPEDLLEIMQGPDFPTGGMIIGDEEIKKAYLTGKGKLTIRGKLGVEEGHSGRPEIIITEIPFGVSKPSLIDKIAELSKDGKISDIYDIRDESSLKGIRIAIELKKGANKQAIIKEIYRQTKFQTTFSIVNLAIVNGQPRILTLKQIIEHYLNHQREILTRKYTSELEKINKKIHIIEGIYTIVNHIDQVIKIIRNSKDTKTAKENLITKYKLTELQSQAIVEMRLLNLTGFEINSVEKQLKDNQKEASRLEKILADKKKIDKIIDTDLAEIKEKYGDDRKTQIIKTEDIPIDNQEEDKQESTEIKQRNIFMLVTNKNNIYNMDEFSYEKQVKNNMIGTTNEYIIHKIPCNTTSLIGLVTSEGNLFKLKISDITESNKVLKPILVDNIQGLKPNTKVVSFFLLEDTKNKSLTFVTKNAFIKKTLLDEIYATRNGTSIIKLKNDDELLFTKINEEDCSNIEEIILTTLKGKSIRFSTKEIRPMGKVAVGVIAMKLDKEDYIVSCNNIIENSDLLIMTSNGFIKRTTLEEYKPQGRGGKGIIAIGLNKKNGEVATSYLIKQEETLVITFDYNETITMSIKDIPQSNRSTGGVKLVETEGKRTITSITSI